VAAAAAAAPAGVAALAPAGADPGQAIAGAAAAGYPAAGDAAAAYPDLGAAAATQPDPDGAGGEVLAADRAVDPHEPYAKLRLPDGHSALTNGGVAQSVVNLATTSWEPYQGAQCSSRFQIPAMPRMATEYNGMKLPDTCFMSPPETQDKHYHVYLVGDWGGLPGPFGWNASMPPPAPADHRSPEFPSHQRDFVWGADDCAQRNVAREMRTRAASNPPDYILNVGDNFYWGGINIKCGASPGSSSDSTSQWKKVFEDVYTGPGIDGKQWLGVLGNHDFGGFMFVSGWDQAIHYTWMQGAPSTNRWVTPALYYQSKVNYPDFSIDYYFVDTNVWDTWLPHAEERHNLCSRNHNPPNTEASCGLVGPISTEECPDWFKSLWKANVAWMDNTMSQSQADWQIVVTHFPPEGEWGGDEWARLSSDHGIDIIMAGHRHRQELLTESKLAPTTYIVSGGGGGITSENIPDADGDDDEYGFVDLTLSSTEIMIEMISHGGLLRDRKCVTQRKPKATTATPLAGTSLCDLAALAEQTPAPTATPPPTAPPAPVAQPTPQEDPAGAWNGGADPAPVAAPVEQPVFVEQPVAPVAPELQPVAPVAPPAPVPLSPMGKLVAALKQVFR